MLDKMLDTIFDRIEKVEGATSDEQDRDKTSNRVLPCRADEPNDIFCNGVHRLLDHVLQIRYRHQRSER